MTSSMKPPNGKDNLHIARSRFVDFHAALERVIVAKLKALGGKPSEHLLGQNIAALRKIKASPSFSKSSRLVLHAALDEVESLQSIRNDVVHGRLSAVMIDGQCKACFVNAREADQVTEPARLISLEQFSGLEKMLAALTERIRGPILNPPSSPPRPSPGAEGGP
jgi:hypothetical protein